MPESVLVSVVVPTVRGGSLLGAAVRSVLSQTVGDFEVIVVTNKKHMDLSGIPDDHRIRVLDESRAGQAFAINRGAFAAKGTWLALLNDDDTWLEQKLERQLGTLEGWNGVEACFTNYLRVDKNGEVINVGIARKATHLDLVAARTIYQPSTLLIRRDLFAVLGGLDTSYRFCGQFDFFLRLSALGDIAFVDEPMVRYLVHEESISQESRTPTWLETARALSDTRRQAVIRGDWDVWRQSWRGTVVHRRLCASAELAFADRSFKRADLSVTVRHVLNALRASPPDVVRLLAKRVVGAV